MTSSAAGHIEGAHWQGVLPVHGPQWPCHRHRIRRSDHAVSCFVSHDVPVTVNVSQVGPSQITLRR